jgi:hypothetical protein
MIVVKDNKAKLTGSTYDLIQEFQAITLGMKKLIEEDNITDMEPGYFVQGLASLALGRDFYAWMSSDTPPENNKQVLLSFENFSIPLVGRYEEDSHGGAYYIGDNTRTCGSDGMIVNAWMNLPTCYREEEQDG